MNISYLIYQAERPRNAAEQREADMRAGELAAAFGRLGQTLRHAVTRKRDAGPEARLPASATVSCAIARPR